MKAPRKSLSERLAAKAATSKRHHELSIHALMPEIEQALEAGFPFTEVWRDLKQHGQITCCLATFKTHVRRMRERQS
ncbi:MAG: TraK family protein [Pseudomonadota bacterium]|jgi:nucleoid DNA-binding protein|nr:TraK family protein [Pseudomonadota bacterium]